MPVPRTVAFFIVLFFIGIFISSARGQVVSIDSEKNDPKAQPRVEVASEAPTAEMNAAMEDFRAGRLEEAFEKLRKLRQNDPRMAPPQLILAQWLSFAQQPQAARAWVVRAMKEMPKDPEAYLVLADVNLTRRRWPEAELLYEKAWELLQEFEGNAERKQSMMQRYYGGLATTMEAYGEFDQARQLLQKLLEKEPENSLALQQLARLHFAEGDLEKALEKLQAAKKADPSLLMPEASLALLLDQQGKKEEAEQWFTKAKEKAPDDLQTRLIIARWELQSGNYQEAAREAEKALKIDPESSQAQLLRGATALFLKDYTTAEAQFRNMLLQSPSNFAAANNLALALSEQEDRDKKLKALEYAKVNVERHPERAEAYSTLGWVLHQLGQNDASLEALQRATQSGQISSNTAYYIAAVLHARGNLDDAELYLKRALESSRPFSMRPEAEKLLEEIRREQGS